MAVPHILPASQVKPFNFYANGSVHEAIFHKGNILKLAAIFHNQRKQEAFDFAHALAQEYFTLITPGSVLYHVWVDIRCQQEFDSSVPFGAQSKRQREYVEEMDIGA